MKNFQISVQPKHAPLFEVGVAVYVIANSLNQAVEKVAGLLSDAKDDGCIYYLFDESFQELQHNEKEWVLRKAGLDS